MPELGALMLEYKGSYDAPAMPWYPDDEVLTKRRLEIVKWEKKFLD